MTKLVTMFAVALAFTGCGKKDDGGGGKGGDKADKAGGGASTGTPDPAAVNALVPAALKDKLVFEKKDIKIEQGRKPTTYTVAAPKGWTQDSKMFASLKADDKGGFFSGMKLGASCGGECTPKKWEEVSDKEQFAPRLAGGKASKDEKGAGKRTMIVTDDNTKTTVVTVAWWKDGDKSYHTCTATLDDSIKDAAPAFEKACQAVAIDGDD